MDLQLARKGLLYYTRKNKRWVLLLVGLGFSSYGAYRVCHLPSVVQKRQRLSKILGALISLAEVISDSAETIGLVSNDLKDFLQSESDQIPNSLNQISKLARSNEFSESVVTLTQALTMGILSGYQSSSRTEEDVHTSFNPSFLDKVFDKLSSPAGSGFVSVIVGSFARNLVMGFYQILESTRETNTDSTDSNYSSNCRVGCEMNSARWVDLVCDEKPKALIGDCVQLFVSTAVAVFLDKTMHINTYDEIFSGMTNPKHTEKVRDVLVSVCNGAMETLVKTSHQVLTSADTKVDSSLSSPYLTIDQEDVGLADEFPESNRESKAIKSIPEVKDAGWVGKVSSTLSVPSNRRLVLDVTGRVTFETIRSFLEFLLEKLYHGIRNCVHAIRDAIVDSGLEAVRFVSTKACVAATICLSLWLHILNGPWVLVSA